MDPKTHYTPTENGYAINGSCELFNRTLYGSHKNDDNTARFFTFAGDTPQFMGAVTDWAVNPITYQEKSGVLVSGLAITPGRPSGFYYTDKIDQTSRWFHNSEDVLAEFKNGWMEYELSQISSWFPDVDVKIEAYPLLPEDGYLVHYHITTNQRCFFAAGFGGITEIQGRFEMKGEPRRYFTADNTKGNTVEIGKNRALIRHTDGKTMRVATSFPADFSIGSAKAMADIYPSVFLGSEAENEDDQVVKISAPIEPGQTLDGYIIAIRDEDESVLDRWLAMDDPVAYIKSQIYAKFACIDVDTPDHPMDLTVVPNVIALDASWHKDAFNHGAFAYHNPYLGWRNWYAPTAMHWNERVEKTIDMWTSYITHGDPKDEKVVHDTNPVIPEGQKGYSASRSTIENAVGRLPAYFGPKGEPLYGPYNMQECALDMMLYYIEWSGNFDFAAKHFDDMCAMVDFETRVFDPDNDGLYQSMLNTWISDGHNYNGAGCTQATAYNYRANLVLSRIAEKIGRDGKRFADRAAKIKAAMEEKLWMPQEGVYAESLDTVGNRLLHPALELPTVYHPIDSFMVDHRKAYRTLRYTEKHLKSITTPGRGGRLSYSSTWLPKQYSNCGLFPSENCHLALAYFQVGLKEQGKKLLDGVTDCFFTGRNPGMAPHIQSNRCTSDLGDSDFTDTSSMYLRMVMEGLFGIRINAVEGYVHIQPGLPSEWQHASLTLQDIALHYHRRGNEETFNIHCDRTETKRFRIPMRAADVELVLLDGEVVPYEIEAGVNNSFMIVKTDKVGKFQLRVIHGKNPIPTVSVADTVLAGNKLVFEVKGGKLTETYDVSETLEDICVVGNKVYARAKNAAGDHTLFLRVSAGQYDAWLAADYDIAAEDVEETPLEDKPFTPVDISEFFNCSTTELHKQVYLHPLPEGFAMRLFKNGRAAHNWSQWGHRGLHVDDSGLRSCGGTVVSRSGIPFNTPAEGDNLACVSIYDRFPTATTFPLTGKGQEVAVCFIASTYWMHTGVENVRFTVTYADGTTEDTSLVYPISIDDWMTSALTTQAENLYISNFNHATVKRIRVNPNKELASIKVEAIANEVILGVVGISVSR